MKNFYLSTLVLLLLSACASPPPIPKYDRSEWSGGRWADTDKNCLNTRHEVLKSRSLVPVKMNKKGCGVTSGKWQDFYSKDIYLKASQVEIDHVVPVKLAHQLSRGQWLKEKKLQFYNDWDNLAVTSKKHNASKGANDILSWQPAHKPAACRQMGIWMKIKKRYDLPILPKEKEYEKLLNCALDSE